MSCDNYIRYLSCGKLGDLIFNLSVINEIFLQSGKKGILFLNEHPEKFQFSLEKTYNDIKNIILSQKYIQDIKIYDGTSEIDINLNIWRNSPYLSNNNWSVIYNKTYEKYNIEWGKHIWLDLPKNDKYKEFIFVFHSTRRMNTNISYRNFIKKTERKVYFITTDITEYIPFKNVLNCEPLIFDDLYEYCVALNSCHMMITNTSFPLCISMGLGRSTIGILPNYPISSIGDTKRGLGLEKIFKNFMWIFDKEQITSSEILDYIDI